MPPSSELRGAVLGVSVSALLLGVTACGAPQDSVAARARGKAVDVSGQAVEAHHMATISALVSSLVGGLADGDESAARLPPDIFEEFGAPGSFVLHDTASPEWLSAGGLRWLTGQSRGPLGLGVEAYIDGEGQLWRGRQLFTPWGPATTALQRGVDLLNDDALARTARRIWDAASDAQQKDALWNALSRFGPEDPRTPAEHRLTHEEVWRERRQATERLSADDDAHVFTTAWWATSWLAEQAIGPQEDVARIRELTSARRRRVGTSVDLELLQYSGSRCNAKSFDRVLSYEDDAYETLARAYLWASARAGHFLRVTTHFYQDAFVRGHCDPRCFDLGRLYRRISELLGLETPRVFGVAPSYGTTYRVHTVWWHEDACGPVPVSPGR